MSEIKNHTIESAHQALLEDSLSAVGLLEFSWSRMQERNPVLNTFISVGNKDDLLSKAQNIDDKLKQKKDINILSGIPLGIKDNIMLKDFYCTAGSQMLEKYKAVYNASVIERLNKTDCLFVGKTNMDEFAAGSSTENSFFGPTKNPYDIDRVAGGTSGGSASAVADNQVIASLGSDTGGSVRQPSAFCGVVGLKPTYGRVSRYGLIASVSSFDQIGPITKTVSDSAILFDAIYGHDPKDATSSTRVETQPFYPICDEYKKMRIGYIPELLNQGLNLEIRDSINNALVDFEKLGYELVEVAMPHLRYALAVYYLIMPAELSSNLARFDGIRYGYSVDDSTLEAFYSKTRANGFGHEIKRRIMMGNYVLSAGYHDAYYKKAQRLRNILIEEYAQVFRKVDCLITPTTPNPAFKIGELIDDPLTLYLEDVYTVSVNIAGVPAISIPCRFTKQGGLPIGMQLIGNYWQERVLFEVGRRFEMSKNI